MTPYEFIEKWRASELKESSAAQEHFIDLCRLLDEPTPAESDPTGERYCFERGVRKETGGDGWADVWKRHHFAWEYKGKHANLDAAFRQLRQYTRALENPPLLIVSDMLRFRVYTNWTNSVSRVHEFELDDLTDAAVRDKLKWALSDPERLRPGETRQALTERAAAAFASLTQGLWERGHDPQVVAHFVNRLVFCMFAEDVGLLPNSLFTRMLESVRRQPKAFAGLARNLFGAMAHGGWVGIEEVAWFDGGLFEDDTALPLDTAEIETVLATADLDWSEIDPSILGTLFERGLDPRKRAQLGAHYTDRDKIMLIIEPVIVRPWLAEWEAVIGEIATCLERADKASTRAARNRHQGRAERLLRDFLERLRGFRVLDPACGSGNFLYLALHALKDLEHQVQLEAATMGLPPTFPEIGPASVKGIEINPYAAELARVSVWIGEIQWMRRNGFSESRKPILKPLDTIECRDAILTPEGQEPDWPQADVVIGNPPFVGGNRLIATLGEDYVSRVSSVYAGRVSGAADLVCYWFEKAGRQIALGRATRAGLVATNSIRGGANRQALQAATTARPIFEAWSDEPWVIDGAAVRVSLICFGRADDAWVLETQLDGQPADEIYTDLTARRGAFGVDLTGVRRLPKNGGVAFRGDEKGGPFDIAGDQAREWLRLPANPNGRTNADVLKPWTNGRDVTRRPAGTWIIDFGWTMSESDAALYEEPFRWVRERVYQIFMDTPRGSRSKPRRQHPALVATRAAISRDAAGAGWPDPVHHYASRRQAPPVRLARFLRMPRQRHDCDCPRRRHDLRRPAQQVSRGVVAEAGHKPGGPPALYADHDLPDFPVSGGADARRILPRLRGRSARRGNRRRRPAAGRAKGPLAQSARMGGVGGRTGPRLPQAPGPPRRVCRQRAQETHLDQPLQPAPPMAHQRPRRPRLRRRRGLRLAGRYLRGGCSGGVVEDEYGEARRYSLKADLGPASFGKTGPDAIYG